jgi:hypothetical protein
MALELTITNEQKILVTSTPVTATGRPAVMDGALSAEIVSGEATWVQGPTPNSIYLVSADNPGDTSFVVSADADLGEGVQLIQDTVLLKVAGALAANLGLVAGVAEAK